MIRRIWLIAEREFRTYVTTATFWLACLIVPVALVVVALLAGHGGDPTRVSVVAADPAMVRAASRAIADAAAADGKSLIVSPTAGSPRLTIRPAVSGRFDIAFDERFPLSNAARLAVGRTLERDEARRAAGLPEAPPSPPQRAAAERDVAKVGRFGVVMMLWLTLTGSLGMLLQAVVRERSNRALEVLLSAVHPQELVVGKVLGVGLVSALVMTLWLASAGGVALAVGGTGGQGGGGALQAMGDPALLATAAVVYVLAFGFYGMATVGIGALARDNAAAQNLARPMFLVLLFAFFFTLFGVGGSASGPGWLTYIPLFSPFLLLMQPPAPLELVGSLALLALSAGLANLWAASVVAKSFASRPSRRAGPR